MEDVYFLQEDPVSHRFFVRDVPPGPKGDTGPAGVFINSYFEMTAQQQDIPPGLTTLCFANTVKDPLGQSKSTLEQSKSTTHIVSVFQSKYSQVYEFSASLSLQARNSTQPLDVSVSISHAGVDAVSASLQLETLSDIIQPFEITALLPLNVGDGVCVVVENRSQDTRVVLAGAKFRGNRISH